MRTKPSARLAADSNVVLSAAVARAAVRARKLRPTVRALELLGQMTDAEVGERLGVGPQKVRYMRRRLGIAAFVPRRPRAVWTAEMLALLGTDSDKNVAAELDLSPRTVFTMRRRLGIEPYHPRLAHEGRAYRFSNRALRLIGTMPDSRLAAELGVSNTVVVHKRLELGIAPFCGSRPPVEWTPKMLSRLGRDPDRDVARKFSISIKTINLKRRELQILPPQRLPLSSRRFTKAFLRLLGKITDRRLADRFHLPWRVVKHKRESLGILGSQATARVRWTAKIIALLGKVSDRDIARRLGIYRSTVRRKRLALGLPGTGRLRGRGPKSTAKRK